MRFASIENGVFGQPEVGVGIVPAGGAVERLPGLVGTARALEIIAGADDYDAVTAERYGWIDFLRLGEKCNRRRTRSRQRPCAWTTETLRGIEHRQRIRWQKNRARTGSHRTRRAA